MTENPQLLGTDEITEQQRKEVIANETIGTGPENITEDGTLPLSVVVIYEPFYNGGRGLEHGSIFYSLKNMSPRSPPDSENKENRPRTGGRLLVVLGDRSSSALSTTERIKLLVETPQRIKLSSGLVTNEVASVQPTLYKTAGELLTVLEPHLRQYNTSCVHFVGHSLAGGVASLAATIFDGAIPMPPKKGRKNGNKKRKKKKPKSTHQEKTASTSIDESNSMGNASDKNNSRITVSEEDDHDQEALPKEPLNGLGRSRSSALTLGCPPCLSGNVPAAFCTSFIFGDDIVCRTTEDSIDRLVRRIKRNLNSGFVGRKLGLAKLSDTLSMTVSSLQSHAHGSEGEESRLSIPGRAYLVRPRRLGGICSIHEVGVLKKGGREALREALLWQMDDVLLSKSMWKHHNLVSYIHGLDRTQLRGVTDDEDMQL